MDPGLSELGTWNAAGATWVTGAVVVAAADAGTGALAEGSGVTSNVEGALAGAGGVASAGAVMVEGGSGAGAVVAEGMDGVGAAGVGVTAAVSVVATSAAGSGTTGLLVLSTTGSVRVDSLSGGGVGSEGCGGAFSSSTESAEAASRLLKDVGNAEAVEPDCGTEKTGLEFDSGGLNKLPDAVPLDKSAAVESSVDFWRPAAKLNCGAPLLMPSPLSPKVNAAAAGLVESLASSP